MAEPTVEFFIPFYGDPDYLLEAVESIRAMDDPEWRLTVLDDCYPHADVGARVAALADPRIEVHRNEQNLGANGNYRSAIDRAVADYVVIMGADDRVLPGYLSRVRAALAATGAAIVQPRAAVIDEEGRRYLPLGDRVKSWLAPRPAGVTAYRGERFAASLLTGNWTYFPSLCWHRETIQRIGFRDYDVVQDLALIIDVLLAGGGFAVAPALAFEYRRHRLSDSSVRALTGERFAEERAYLATIASELDAHGWPWAARAARARLTSRLNAGLTALSVAPRDRPAARRIARTALS
ncbi:MAG TPA: glycosyltransferase family 2 protein [Nocardioides sp.]|nr:glycosyltransferase family 2 protein [Nocardioides sp.]